jgi:Fe2+ transport system protein FeoA
VQTDAALLQRLHSAGIDPGAQVKVEQNGDTVTISHGTAALPLTRSVASRVFVTIT